MVFVSNAFLSIGEHRSGRFSQTVCAFEKSLKSPSGLQRNGRSPASCLRHNAVDWRLWLSDEIGLPNHMSEDDRRQSRRVSYFIEARLEGIDVGRSNVRIADLSADGAFVDARTVLPAGATARLSFAIDSTEVSVLVEVRNSMVGFGMGVRFIDVDDATRRVLTSAIARRTGS